MNDPGSVVQVWDPMLARIYNLKPLDLLDFSPFQLEKFREDKPQPLF